MPIKRQCELLNIARSTVYYQPIGLSVEEIGLCRIIDEIHLQYPFMGSRRVRTELAKKGHNVNRKRVIRIMRDMGIGAIYPKPKTQNDTGKQSTQGLLKWSSKTGHGFIREPELSF